MNIHITVTSEELGDLEVTVEARHRMMQDDPRTLLQSILSSALGKVERAYELDPQ